MRRGGVFGVLTTIVLPAMVSGCTPPVHHETAQEHVRRLLKARIGHDVKLENLDLSGSVHCGRASPGGPFLVEGEELVFYPEDPARFRTCGPDFVEPGPPFPT